MVNTLNGSVKISGIKAYSQLAIAFSAVGNEFTQSVGCVTFSTTSSCSIFQTVTGCFEGSFRTISTLSDPCKPVLNELRLFQASPGCFKLFQGVGSVHH